MVDYQRYLNKDGSEVEVSEDEASEVLIKIFQGERFDPYQKEIQAMFRLNLK